MDKIDGVNIKNILTPSNPVFNHLLSKKKEISEILCHEIGVETMAVQVISASHLVGQHSIDNFIIDLMPVSEAQVVSLPNSAEAKLTVDRSGWGVWSLVVWSLVVNNYWLLTLTPTTLCISISTWSYIYNIVRSDVYDNGIKSHKY